MKTTGVQSEDFKTFIEKMNKQEEDLKTAGMRAKFTQTHVTPMPSLTSSGLVYTAVIYYE